MSENATANDIIWQNLAQLLPQAPLLASLRRLAQELLQWNKTHNLTGFQEERAVAVHLFWDALILSPHLKGATLLDIGSGAGFPCLVLALAHPELKVVSLEPRAKRLSFQKHARRSLNLPNLEIIAGRAGASPDPLAGRKFANITIKAVGDLARSLELARPYLDQAGQILMPRGGSAIAPSWPGLTCQAYALPPPGGQRQLFIYKEPAAE